LAGHQVKKFITETIVLCAIAIVVTYGFAQTWTQTSASTNQVWEAVACSADGKVILAVSSSEKPLISRDSGDTWTTNGGFIAYLCAASSADGTKLVAPALFSGIYVSSDSGNTWIQTSAPQSDWRAIASSANGTKLFAGSSSVWISTNSGSTWQVSSAPNKGWLSLASSADGTKLIGSGSGQIYISTNSGTSWQLSAVSGISVATSADGNTLVVTGSGSTYISTNSGSSWMTNAINGSSIGGSTGNSAASSADGKRLAIAGFNSQIYTSTDSGITWITNDAPSSWNGVVSSADGCKLFAAMSSYPVGGIWIGQIPPSPELKLKVTNSKLGFSWTLPSTNFVLQQNLDLTTTNWVTLTNMPTLNLTNLQNQLTFPPTNSSSFFRLSTQ
jgi:photosystem II stability/assembly factor-like uncharacterized protein